VICKEAEEVKKNLRNTDIVPWKGLIQSLRLTEECLNWVMQVRTYNLGLFYFKGLGVGVDKAEGAKWFRLAATQSHADAQLLEERNDCIEGVREKWKTSE
jgi:hypothetical protein